MKDLAKEMAERRKKHPMTKEAYDKAFGGAKAVEAAVDEGDAVVFADVKVLEETDLARRVAGVDKSPVWLPKSAHTLEGDSVSVARWLAKKEGWI